MLTKKQELTIQYVIDGMNRTEAVQKAFDCKNKGSASSLAYKLFKQKEVQDRLTEKQANLDQQTIDKYVDFLHLVEANIPKISVINKLKELMHCGDKRVELQSSDMYLKIIGGYKEKETKAIEAFKDL